MPRIRKDAPRRVYISAREVEDFADRWPCSGLRMWDGKRLDSVCRPAWFDFDTYGNLVDFGGLPGAVAAGAINALVDDARTYYRSKMETAR